MSRNQIDQLTRLLQDAQQLIADLDCGPIECHACVDTEDIAYIELPIDGDGTARSISDWAFALEVLVALAHAEWTQGELYTAFRSVMNNTNPFEPPLPEWEEVERLMEEQSHLRDTYFNLIYFLENPDEYADFLRREAETLARESGLTLGEAKAAIAAVTLSKLQDELEMARGEKATPEFAQMYDTWIAAGGDNFAAWLEKWIGKS